MKDTIKRKLSYAGHVMRGSCGLSHLQILERRIDGTIKVGAPRRTWTKDILGWIGQSTYGAVKRVEESRESWISTVSKC